MIADLVRGLLTQSGYSVYLNGWEERFSEIREQLNDVATKNSRTVRMIQSSPDLLVYDKKRKDATFVEVKMRRARNEKSVLIGEGKIAPYKEFWNDAILVVVIPCGNVFYAQRFNELRDQRIYNAETDFEKLQHMFLEIKEADIESSRSKAIQALGKLPNRDQ